MAAADWRPHFEGRGNYRADCRECGLNLDVRFGFPAKHLREKHPGPQEPASKGAGLTPPPEARTPAAPSKVAGRDREALLRGLWEDSENVTLSATERARARELIAKVEGYADEPDADDDTLRERHRERIRKDLARVVDFRAELKEELRDFGTRNEVKALVLELETEERA